MKKCMRKCLFRSREAPYIEKMHEKVPYRMQAGTVFEKRLKKVPTLRETGARKCSC